ncbi:MAG TPA: adenylyl-sulfate kinase, partial [Elusimicrobiales bacterium]|nr:adenylyl-sulfate kinase [Elusimicrobiales bacterium]
GFARQARNAHNKRMGHLASLLEKHGVIVLASFISPYRSSRAAARSFCRNFFEIYLSARLPECEGRDVKGHYRRARAGRLPKFTGIGDGYEPPLKPELSIDTGHQTPEASFERLRPLLDRLARGVRRK